MSKPRTWILVADGSRARIFRAAGKGKIEQCSEVAIDHPPSREMASDRPGRTFDSQGAGRHAKEPASDPHEHAETEFLRSLAVQLDASHKSKEYDRLVIIAAPRALGTLRKNLSSGVSKSVAEALPHDLTGFTNAALETYLEERKII